MDLSAWMAEELQTGIYFKGAWSRSEVQDLWREVVNDEPDMVHSERQGGETILSASHGSGSLVLMGAPSAIQWVLRSPESSDDLERLARVQLGSYSKIVADFRALCASSILRSKLKADRLGFSAVLFVPFESREEALTAVGEVLPGLGIGPRDTLIEYAVNRPIDIDIKGVGDLAVNRVVSWSLVQSNALAGQRPEAARVITLCHKLKLAIDCNTVSMPNGPVVGEALVELHARLIELVDGQLVAGD